MHYHHRPIFIFGCPRSGTSLLSRIIDFHPQITIPFESHLYNTFYPWLEYYGDLNVPTNRQRLVKDILSTEVLKSWEPRLNKQQILAGIERNDFHGIVESVMSGWTKVQGKQRWGEKTPQHVFYWREILQAFPDMQVIHIVRDGRDVALSWKKARFGPKHIYHLAKRWVCYTDKVEELKANLNADAFLEVKYEDLLSNSELVTKDICNFLGEDFTPQMLDFHTKGKSYPTDKINQKNLSRPLMVNNIGKWRKQMSDRQLRIFEAVAGETLEHYGYKRFLSKPRMSALEAKFCCYIEHPPRKIIAMAKNRQGYLDALSRLLIYLRLRLVSLTKRLKPSRVMGSGFPSA